MVCLCSILAYNSSMSTYSWKSKLGRLDPLYEARTRTSSQQGFGVLALVQHILIRVGVSYQPTGSRKINVTNAVYLLRFYGRLGIYLRFVYSFPIKISSGQEAYFPFRSISLKIVWEYTLSHLINLKMDFIFLHSVRIC